MVGRIPVMDVSPVVECGRYPAKAAVGEAFPVTATIFREGHDELNADLVVTGPDGKRRPPVRMSKDATEPDIWHASNTDRKSTRLNSSHVEISYAVFCLKKKKRPQHCIRP